MLVDVRSDADFQRFLDRREQELHVKMVPIIAQGMRLTIQRGSINAMAQVVKRGEPVLVAHAKRVFREVYGSVNRARFAKQSALDEDDNEDVTEFMGAQLGYIRTEAARSITRIAKSLSDDIRDTVFQGVEAGWSNDKITRELVRSIPDFSRNRAATIARTETHGAATWAMDETIQYKGIEIVTKRWRANMDSRVRPSHEAMNDVAVPKDEPFDTDDGPMMYPGDDSLGADPGGIINCRCVCLYETEAAPALEGEEEEPLAPEEEGPPTEDELDAASQEAEDYVRRLGRITGAEHLRWIDRDTGELADESATGTASHVEFPDALMDAVRDPDRQMEVHHNHPKDTSLSWGDILTTERNPGLARMWAHGNAGSSYLATDVRPGATAMMKRLEFSRLSDWLEAMPRDMANRIFLHARNRAVANQGWFDYTADLAPDLAGAVADNQSRFDLLVEQLQGRIGRATR